MALNSPAVERVSSGRGLIKSPQNLAAGLFLLFFAMIALFGAWDLSFGQLRGIGPGLMPKVTAVMLAGFGLTLVALAFLTRGAALDRWSIRGPFFVLGAVLLFAATIRGIDFGKGVNLPLIGQKFPALGLVVAGPLAILFASFADPTTRLREVLIFTVVMMAFCIGLFKYALRLPIPLAPWLIGY